MFCKKTFRNKPWLPDPATWKGTWREDWRVMGQEGYLKGKMIQKKLLAQGSKPSQGNFRNATFALMTSKKKAPRFGNRLIKYGSAKNAITIFLNFLIGRSKIRQNKKEIRTSTIPSDG